MKFWTGVSKLLNAQSYRADSTLSQCAKKMYKLRNQYGNDTCNLGERTHESASWSLLTCKENKQETISPRQLVTSDYKGKKKYLKQA
jgi:hypothetical protein